MSFPSILFFEAQRSMLWFISEVNMMFGYGIYQSKLQVFIILGTIWKGGGKWQSEVNTVTEKCLGLTVRITVDWGSLTFP